MLKTVIYDFVYVFLNSVISHIPCWTIRKYIYILLGMKIDKGSRICMRTRIMEPWNIVIGRNTIINEACIIDGRGGLRIGSNCSISAEAIIYTASHKTDSNDFGYFEEETVIGDGVWIGARTVILPGSVIEDYVVIGACSVVICGIYQSNAIYVGIPAKKKKNRDITDMKDLKHKMVFR